MPGHNFKRQFLTKKNSKIFFWVNGILSISVPLQTYYALLKVWKILRILRQKFDANLCSLQFFWVISFSALAFFIKMTINFFQNSTKNFHLWVLFQIHIVLTLVHDSPGLKRKYQKVHDQEWLWVDNVTLLMYIKSFNLKPFIFEIYFTIIFMNLLFIIILLKRSLTTKNF
jgi:hypothetical protein